MRSSSSSDWRRCSPRAAAAASRARRAPRRPAVAGAATFPRPSTAPGRRSRRPSTRRRSTAFHTPNSKITVNYNPVGSGSGQERPPDQDGRLRRHRQPARSRPTSAPTRAARVLYFPTVAAPITVSYNLSGVKKLQLSGTDARQDLRPEDQEVERRRDRRRQPGRDAARRPRSPSRTAPTAPARRTTSRSSSPTSTRPTGRSAAATPSTGLARHDAGRRQEHGCRADREVDRRRHRLRRPRRREGGRAPVRLDQEQGRQVRRPDACGRGGRGREHDGQGRPVLRPDQRIGCGRPTRSRRRRGSSCTQSRRATTSGPALKEFLQYIYGPGQALAPTVGYAALPASTVQKAVAQLSKFQIPAS